jgi:hypothetical protein
VCRPERLSRQPEKCATGHLARAAPELTCHRPQRRSRASFARTWPPAANVVFTTARSSRRSEFGRRKATGCRRGFGSPFQGGMIFCARLPRPLAWAIVGLHVPCCMAIVRSRMTHEGALRPWVETHGYHQAVAPRRRHMSRRGHSPRSGMANVAGPFKARYPGAKFRSRRGATMDCRDWGAGPAGVAPRRGGRTGRPWSVG